MKKNRYLLCLLACGMMLYFAIPKLPSFNGELPGFFTLSWLILALFVFAGNLSALLYVPKKGKIRNDPVERKMSKRKRMYS